MTRFWIWFLFTVGAAWSAWMGGCSWNSFFVESSAAACVLFVQKYFGKEA